MSIPTGFSAFGEGSIPTSEFAHDAESEKMEPHPYQGPMSSTYCYKCGYGRQAPIHNSGK